MATADDIFDELEKTRVKELFDAFDSNHDGKISAEELQALCKQFGHDLPAEKAKEVIARNDPEGTGSVDWENFCVGLAVVLVKIKVAIVLVSLFRALDSDGSGFITEADLNSLVKQANADIPPAKVKELVKKCDANGDGQISFQEFIQALVTYLRSQA